MKFIKIVMILIFVTSIHAVDLVPENTVQKSTGTMQFNLPLATVKGANGKDHHINVNYRSGIKVRQKSSSIGLGFSSSPGVITRNVVHYPDDFVHEESKGRCETDVVWEVPVNVDESNKVIILKAIKTFFSMLITVVTNGLSTALNVAVTALSYIVDAGLGMAIEQALGTPDQLLGGGDHLPEFDTDVYASGILVPGISYTLKSENHLFTYTTKEQDHPDIFYISTSFVSGYFRYDEITGKLKFTKTCGIGNEDENKEYDETIIIDLDLTTKCFTIVLKNGTRLLFEEYDAMSNHTRQYYSENVDGSRYFLESIYEQRTPIINQWHLTKVLYSDYVDGNGNNNPLDSENKGEWIVYEYTNEIDDSDLCQHMYGMRRGIKTMDHYSMEYISGRVEGYHNSGNMGGVTLKSLKSIKTPNEYAKYNYSSNFKFDDIWKPHTLELTEYYQENGIKGLRELESIDIYSRAGQKRKSIQFQHDYSLREGSPFCIKIYDFLNSIATGFLDNPDAKSLTLNKIKVINHKDKDEMEIKFNYDYNPPVHPRIDGSYLIEDMYAYMEDGTSAQPTVTGNLLCLNEDVWGYFCKDLNREMNISGTYDYSHDVNGDAYAAAWSLTSVELPNGKKISWDYESNVYDKANNIFINSGSNKYSGGVRVNKMSVENGMGDSYSYNYFYNDEENGFVEHDKNTQYAYSNSSGHATIEPIYNRSSEYRDERVRGGYYTPSMILYEDVKVAKNFDENLKCPTEGYSQYEFITSKDYTNGGDYGEIDKSWKRGIEESIKVKRNNHTIIREENKVYVFNSSNEVNYPEINRSSSNSTENDAVAYNDERGWAILHSKEVKQNNVPIITENRFPAFHQNSVWDIRYKQFDYIFKPGTYKTGVEMMKAVLGGGAARTKEFGNTEKLDYLFGAKNWKSGHDWKISYIFYKDVEENNFSFQESVKGVISDDELSQIEPGPFDKADMFGDLYFYSNNPTTVNLIMSGIDNRDSNGDLLPEAQIVYYVFKNFSPGEEITDFEINRLPVPIPVRGVHTLQDQADILPVVKCLGLKNLIGNSTNDLVFWVTWKMTNLDINDEKNEYFENYLIIAPDVDQDAKCTNVNDIEICVVGHDLENGFSQKFNLHSNFFNMYISNPSIPEGDISASYSSDYALSVDFYANDGDGLENDILFTSYDNNTAGNKIIKRNVLRNFTLENDNPYQKYMFNYEENVELELLPFEFSFLNGKGVNCFTALPPKQGYGNNFIYGLIYADSDNENNLGIKNHVVVDKGTVTYEKKSSAYTSTNQFYNSINDVNKIVVTTPAFEKYPKMMENTNRALNGICEKKVYSNNVSDENIISAEVYTWEEINDYNKIFFKVKSKYRWKSNTIFSSGCIENFVEFDFSSPENNVSNWVKVYENELNNEFGNIIQKALPLNEYDTLRTVNVYGHNSLLKVGKIENAYFDECGILTCDYMNDNNIDYIDALNGWEKCGSEISNEKHWGEKSIFINLASGSGKYGPTRNFKIYPNTDYVLSAWVKVIEGELVVSGDYRYIEGKTDNILNVGGAVSGKSFGNGAISTNGDEWHLVTLNIPASSDISTNDWDLRNDWGTRIFIGSPNGVKAYINDIRFYPKDALVKSYYYDQLLQLPMISLDENNNPSNKVEYDGWGRVNEISKFTNNGEENILNKYEYNFMNKPDLTLPYIINAEKQSGNNTIDFSWLPSVSEKNESILYDVYIEDIGIIASDLANTNFSRNFSSSESRIEPYEWYIVAKTSSTKTISLKGEFIFTE